ncbi:hypothetical protein [Trinickia sp.]|uniref:hypothetical protein n=1 Tax=Trinickia sp. TaxID=2571163 RepID=UPI003F7D32F3
MSIVTRIEFEARIEAIEARMDARVAGAVSRIDALIARMDERDKRLDERDMRLDERDNRLDERDKRLEMLVQAAAASAQNASNLKTHLWLAASTLTVAVVGTVIASSYATQAAHLGMAQTLISAFQQGQQAQLPVRE